MPVFRYEAINSAGKTVSGVYKAELAQGVEQWLLEKGLSPVDIQVVGDKKAGLAGMTTVAGDTSPSFFQKLQGVTVEDKILFCQQISTMLYAGVALLQTLKIMEKQVNNPVLREMITDITARIESGLSLSEAVAKYPKVFNTLFQNLLRVGEESGNLDNSFNYLSKLFENEKEINEQIKAVTRYPKMLISAMLMAVIFLMSFVVPKFLTMFSKSSAELPFATRLLTGISDFFSSNFVFIAIGIAGAVFAYRMALKNDDFVLARDKLTLRLPVYGDLTKKIHMSRFCRVFAVLTASGVDIIRTLQLANSSLGNVFLFQTMEEVTGEVEEGVDFFESMARRPLFPTMVVQMIAVGEESGQMETMMEKVADYYEVETNYTIKNLSSFIEPVLLLGMGLMVGFLALAIFSPMWGMMDAMR
ncbi:MAG: type II secretion system F family protein, partial [Desulfobulbaceae bacterium]|nr:type II secretion system F family protein [Desulfobulbaceae bacterium]